MNKEEELEKINKEIAELQRELPPGTDEEIIINKTPNKIRYIILVIGIIILAYIITKTIMYASAPILPWK